MQTTLLSTLHRSLIALSALQLGIGPREAVLLTHQVTEEDLRAHQPEWEQLQALREAKRSDFEIPLRVQATLAQATGRPGGSAAAK